MQSDIDVRAPLMDNEDASLTPLQSRKNIDHRDPSGTRCSTKTPNTGVENDPDDRNVAETKFNSERTDCRQPDSIQKKLLETSPELGDSGTIKNEKGYRRVLNICVEELKSNMDPEAVLDGLIKHEIGRKNNYQAIKDMRNTYEKNDKILDIVSKSGFEAYKKFKLILFETRHDDLLQQMKKAEEKILSEGDDSTDQEMFSNPNEEIQSDGSESMDCDREMSGNEGVEDITSSTRNTENSRNNKRSDFEDKTPNGMCHKGSNEDFHDKEVKQYLLSLLNKLWDELVHEGNHIQDFLQRRLEIPEMLATHIESPVYEDCENTLPPDLEAHISSSNGDCLYNSVSLALYGDERSADLLRLAAVCNAIVNRKAYIKQFLADRPDAEGLRLFTESVLTEESRKYLDASKKDDPGYLAEFTLQKAVKETIKPGSYSGQLQIQFLSSAIGYTVHQYFQEGVSHPFELKPMEAYEIHPLWSSKRRGDESIRILWVKGNNSNTVSHIMPVLKKTTNEEKRQDSNS